MSKAGFAYAQARLHARLEGRFSEGDWRMLASSRTFGSCIDAANQTTVANITARLDRTYSVHAVEQVLREEWSALVSDISAWLPNKWRDATIWMTILPQLRRFEYVSVNGRPLRWLQLETESPEAAAVLLSAGERGLQKREVAKIWHNEWCLRLPDKRHSSEIDIALAPLFDRYLGNVSPRANGASDDWQNLVDYLMGLFRRFAQTPVAIFAFIGLIALDFERLRGIFAERIVFSEPSEAEEI